MANRNKIVNFAFTYPQTGCGREEFIKKLPPVVSCICVQEEHQDGGKHLHASVKLRHGITFARMQKWLASKFPEEDKRIKIQTVRNQANWDLYLAKEDSDPYMILETKKEDRERWNRVKRFYGKHRPQMPCEMIVGIETWYQAEKLKYEIAMKMS